MAAKSAIIARVAMNLVPLVTAGTLSVVYAPGTATGVKPVPDELISWPAALLLPGDAPVIPGMWERQTWAVNGTVWVRNQPRGERIAELTDLGDDILGAFRQPDTTAVDAAVQSVILTSFGAITEMQWQRGDGAGWYLVLPFTLELKVNRSVTYGPA